MAKINLSKKAINILNTRPGFYAVADLTQGSAWQGKKWENFRELTVTEAINFLKPSLEDKALMAIYYWCLSSDKSGRTDDGNWVPAASDETVTQLKAEWHGSPVWTGLTSKGGRKRMAIRTMLREISTRDNW